MPAWRVRIAPARHVPNTGPSLFMEAGVRQVYPITITMFGQQFEVTAEKKEVFRMRDAIDAAVDVSASSVDFGAFDFAADRAEPESAEMRFVGWSNPKEPNSEGSCKVDLKPGETRRLA